MALVASIAAASCAAPQLPAAPASPPAPSLEVPPLPLLRIDAAGVTLDGTPIADAASFERTGELRRLDALLAALRRSGTRELRLEVAAGARMNAVASAVMTAGLAGARDMHVRAGERSFSARFTGFEERPGPRSELRLEAREDGFVVAWATERACAFVPPVATVRREALHGRLARDCAAMGGGACAERTLLDLSAKSSPVEAFAALADAMPFAGTRPAFDLHWGTPSLATRRCGGPVPARSLGRLDPSVIQRTVRDGFVRPRACYEAGLRRDPNLTGRVSTSFVIQLDGTVADAVAVRVGDLVGGRPYAPPAGGAPDLPDPAVVDCVVDSFRTLRFPPPEGGIVTVVYPIIFNPGD